MNKDSEILKVFARNLKNARHSLGLSQEDLAAKAGMHRTYIGMIERCEKNITLINIDKIANALGVKIDELFKNSDGT